MRSRTIRRLRSSDGFAVPVAMGIMMVAALLAGLAIRSADGASGFANDDRRSKRALAAAEAGLQKAAYRLNRLRPNATLCLAHASPYTASPVNGECPASTPESLAPDATFRYVGTPALAAGSACADQPTVPAGAGYFTDHCITSTGTVGGLSRRVQARVRVQRGSIFNQVGLVGKDFVTFRNSITVNSDLGSNGQIRAVNSVSISSGRRILIPNTAPAPLNTGSAAVVRVSTPWDLPQTDFAPSLASNNNNLIPASALKGTRELVLGDGVGVTLQTGVYNVCEVYADNSNKVNFTIAAGAKVSLYIDSPDRPGSGCAAGTGRFCLDNSIELNKAGQATQLEIFMYGAPANFCSTGRTGMPFNGVSSSEGLDAKSDLVFGNSVDFVGTIYAPRSAFRNMNSVRVTGAIAAASVDMGNSVTFTWPNSVRDAVVAPGPVRRLGWTECRSTPTVATDPESGCV
jgi:Tfp pilus assembly protein PilX